MNLVDYKKINKKFMVIIYGNTRGYEFFFKIKNKNKKNYKIIIIINYKTTKIIFIIKKN